jgi:hypothetical protein
MFLASRFLMCAAPVGAAAVQPVSDMSLCIACVGASPAVPAS